MLNAKTPRRQGKRDEGRQLVFSLFSSFIAWRLGVLAFTLLFLGVLPAMAAEAKAPLKSTDYLLHLPGIAGYHGMDRQLLEGLRDGGFTGDVDVIDWPG